MTVRCRMPAEWEPHKATWLTWPTNKTTWPGKLLKEVELIYLRMMGALLAHEKVNLLISDPSAGKRIVGKLEGRGVGTGRLILHPVRYVDSWIRDYGPIFVKQQRMSLRGAQRRSNLNAEIASVPSAPRNDRVAFTKWILNAWGGKYADLAWDNGFVDKISALKNTPRVNVPMVLEGGSIDVNGRGTCLTTEQCLLNANRNPKLSRKAIEGCLKKYLGVEKTIWLKEGIEGDDTDGHVDDIARFVGPATVLTAVEPDREDRNHAILEENLRILKRERTHDGKKLSTIELPMPGRVTVQESHTGGDRLPASYANFYIANHAVLLPVYGHKNDKAAVRVLKKAFPDRKIVPIECTALVYGLGSIHCITQQEPY